jgi:hypothetical protein
LNQQKSVPLIFHGKINRKSPTKNPTCDNWRQHVRDLVVKIGKKLLDRIKKNDVVKPEQKVWEHDSKYFHCNLWKMQIKC